MGGAPKAEGNAFGMRSFKGYRWRYLFKEITAPDELVQRYGYLLAQLLVNRGLQSPPSEKGVQFSFSSLPKLEEATDKILSYAKSGKPIYILGDYDVDGLTSTAIMYKLLKRLGAQRVVPFVPERDEGYGLQPHFVNYFYKRGGPGLIIALDNGTKELETIALAQRLGFEVVIFDHHTPGEKLPQVPLVNPKTSSSSPGYVKDLSTAGLVYLFALYLKGRGIVEHVEDLSVLSALGTVADVVALSEVNARIVRKGLSLLNKREVPSLGLKFLLEHLMRENLNENDIAFRIAPRLNAFGRMGRARWGLLFLITEEEEKAKKLLRWMEYLNDLRKGITKRELQKVFQYYERHPDRALIYLSPNIPKGILGIIAGRATSALGVPALIFSTDGDTVVGSTRSPEGINIVELLGGVEHLLERWGGHAQAAGLTLKYDKFEEFRRAFMERMRDVEPQPPTLEIDLPLKPNHLRSYPALREALMRLEPFGSGNRPPNFVFDDRVQEVRKTPYGYAFHFAKSGLLYLNTDSDREVVPPNLKGRRVRVVYSVRKVEPLELQMEDFAVL